MTRSRVVVRQSLQALLEATVADPSSSFGYAVSAVSFGEAVEVTLEKAGASFVLWLRPLSEEAPCYKRTAQFNLGYRHDPPDRLGYALLNAACARITAWERRLPAGAHRDLFDDAAPPFTQPTGPPVDAATQAVLSQATFSSIYGEWLGPREGQLVEWFEGLRPGRKNVLVVNATKGLPFYASIADFFVLLQRVHQGVQVTGVSYFDEIFEFHAAVAAKGLPIVPVAEVMSWGAAEINRFDVVILIGASDIMTKLMALDGATPRLVLLDLGFYHQILDAHPDWYPGCSARGKRLVDTSSQTNRAVVYSCQPEEKITRDLDGLYALDRLEWRWFDYIPIGFTYSTYYRADRCAFDVGLLGTDRREYAQIDPDLFRGMRFLFVGALEKAPALERLGATLDLTAVSRVDEDAYARLLAMCRCVVLPHPGAYVENVFMSVVDTVAAGRALVTPRHPGIARLERDALPVAFYDASPGDLFHQVEALIRDDGRREEIAARSVAFAKEKLDVYRILGRILAEQVL